MTLIVKNQEFNSVSELLMEHLTLLAFCLDQERPTTDCCSYNATAALGKPEPQSRPRVCTIIVGDYGMWIDLLGVNCETGERQSPPSPSP